MAGTRRGARSVMKWFAAVYVVLIVVQVFLAGEGIFGLNAIKHSDDCDKKGADPTHLAQCAGNTKSLDPHRALGFFLTGPGAILFLIVALLAWHPVSRVRIVSIVLPFLAFVQMLLPGAGRWVAAPASGERDPAARPLRLALLHPPTRAARGIDRDRAGRSAYRLIR